MVWDFKDCFDRDCGWFKVLHSFCERYNCDHRFQYLISSYFLTDHPSASHMLVFVYISVHMKRDSWILLYIYIWTLSISRWFVFVFMQVFIFHASVRGIFWLFFASPERKGKTLRMSCRRETFVMNLKIVSGGISHQRISPTLVRKEKGEGGLYSNLFYPAATYCGVCHSYLIVTS